MEEQEFPVKNRFNSPKINTSNMNFFSNEWLLYNNSKNYKVIKENNDSKFSKFSSNYPINSFTPPNQQILSRRKLILENNRS